MEYTTKTKPTTNQETNPKPNLNPNPLKKKTLGLAFGLVFGFGMSTGVLHCMDKNTAGTFSGLGHCLTLS